MKIVFDRDEMINAVSPMLGVVSNKSTIAALECVLIETKEEFQRRKRRRRGWLW